MSLKLTSRSLAAVAALLLLGVSARAQDDDDDGNAIDDRPHITMLGTATAQVSPDVAILRLGVESERPDAAAAAEASAAALTAVIAAAKAGGVAPADIATETISLEQTFDDISDSSGRITGRKPRGFSASDTIRIQVRDLGKTGTIAQSLIAKGANRFDGISFSLDNPEPVLAKLTGEAVANARRRAESAAAAAGLRLGPVLQIERPDGGSPSVGNPMVHSLKSSAIPVEPGTGTFSTTVEVTFAIAP